MIIKDKNKLIYPPRPSGTPQEGNKSRSKILVLGFILLIVGVGFFSSGGKVEAATPLGTCDFYADGFASQGGNSTDADCKKLSGEWKIYPATATTPAGAVAPTGIAAVDQAAAARAAATEKSDFEKYISQNGCGLGVGNNTSLLPGCLISGSYYLFYAIPSGILWLAAYFFNILISVTLSSKLLLAPFVASAWAVVRDLSNLFFILILLYVAIELILGLGNNAKKMIVHVIIVTLLINFSMFFTKVVIDSSNILALVFYNKLDVCANKDTTGKCRPYDSVTGEKDISGSMMDAFDPTRLLTGDFFKTAGTIDVPGVGPTSIPISYQMIILVTILAGLVMLFAAYAFFIAGLSFMGRMIELFVLIVFSPFALMSSSIPLLEKVDYIGWKSWLSRLLTVAFMAPIFMFFMYFIFMLVSVKPGIFASLVTQTGDGMLVRIMSVIIPAGLLLILLLKATDFAKKGSGAFGEALMTAGKMIGGLALAGTIGGAAIASRASIGRVGAKFANSELAKKWEAKGWGGESARRLASSVGSGSFDIRGVKVMGKDLAGATGMKLGDAQKGGFTERRKAQVESRMKRAKEIEVGEDETLKQNLNSVQREQQDLLRAASHELEQLDNQIKGAKEASEAAAAALRAETPGTAAHTTAQTTARNAAARVIELRKQKKDIKEADGSHVPLLTIEVASARAAAAAAHGNVALANKARAVETALAVARISLAGRGRSINQLGDEDIPDAQHHLETENRRRRNIYADTTEGTFGRVKNALFSGGQSSYKGSREAAHNIRMETKIETKTT